ncbi:hypothetical protein GCM10015535_67120 [Streptomyces gelaticus]|uniref:Uncharacterized protein n=1 Tax=Streptomyces gelaticus TaxID=285446 RepID=A0ABQ2W8M2_9ACTN|nr:hypothetical protein [Streptomyces gelaticus]GGV96870.1 hypothetical protein GCM10015535_67120 [Streptomyces gelaticus]
MAVVVWIVEGTWPACLGTQLAARVLAEIGNDRTHFADARFLLSLSSRSGHWRCSTVGHGLNFRRWPSRPSADAGRVEGVLT